MSSAGAPRHLELLGIQIEADLDRDGREIGVDGITIAVCEEGQVMWVGADVPEAVADELRVTFDRAERPRDSGDSRDPNAPPAALEPSRRILERVGGPVRCDAGPSYLFPPETRFASAAAIARSDSPTSAVRMNTLRGGNPGNWDPIEWDELLGGRLGPWAIAMDSGVVVSICHTARPLAARAAECGVWTRPGFRGRGHAAAVTSEWAALVRAKGRSLFTALTRETGRRSSSRVASISSYSAGRGGSGGFATRRTSIFIR